MNTTLRAKLSLLVAIALCFTVGPILYITYRTVNATALRMEQKAFADLIVIEEESINASYMNLLKNKVSSVVNRKRLLANSARQARDTSRDLANMPGVPTEAHATLITGIMRRMTSDQLWMERFDKQNLTSGSGMVTSLGLTLDVRDAKGRMLTNLLDKLPSDGDFAVFHLPFSLRVAGNTFAIVPVVTQPVLAFFLPAEATAPSQHTEDKKHANTGDIFVAMTPLRDLEEQAAASEKDVIRTTQEKFSTLNVYKHGFIAMLDGKGRTLAYQGEGSTPDVEILTPYLEQARRTGRAEAQLPSVEYGDMLYLFAYTPAFDWYVVMAAPLDAIRAPSTALLTHLLTFGATAMAIALAVVLFMLARTLRPLDLLTSKTEALPSMDFASPDTEALIARDLPLKRHDEVGRLARSFALMGRALSKNIRALMVATASKERMEGELNAAREIQLGILPPPDGAPNIFGFTASAFLDPAKEVGGDLYDFFTTPDGRNALVLGDVSGKGVPAALFMSMTVTLVRYALSGGLDPAEAMSRINTLLEEHNPGNMFVTLFLALYNPQTGDFEYANGGHCPPYVVDSAPGSIVRTLEGLSGPMVGVLPGIQYTQHHDRLSDGEICLLFTDGVTEAMNSSLELYGEERLMAFLKKHSGDGPKNLLQNVFADLVRYRGDTPASDDITMLAFARR